MVIKPIQSNFSFGEVTPRMRAQSALPQVATGCKKLENMHAESHGIAAGRHGTDFIGSDISSAAGQLVTDISGSYLYGAASISGFQRDNTPIRIIPFSVNVDQAYIVVFSDNADYVGSPHTSRISVYDSSDKNLNNPETFERQAIADIGINENVSDFPDTPVPYAHSEIQDVHFVQIKDMIVMVHSHYPPMKLIRYNVPNSATIKWGFTFLGTYGSEWGDGLRIRDAVTAQGKKLGYPRTVGYYQQRLVFGGMTHATHRLVFTRTDDLTKIDKGFWSSHEDDFETVSPEWTYPTVDPMPTGVINYMHVQGSLVDLKLLQVFRGGIQLDPPLDSSGNIVEGLTGLGLGDYMIHKNLSSATGEDINPNSYTGFGADGFCIKRFLRSYKGAFLSIEFPLSQPNPAPAKPALHPDYSDVMSIVITRPEDSGLTFDIAATDQNHIQWVVGGEGLFIGTTGGEWVAYVDNYISNMNPPMFSQVSSYGSQHIQPMKVGDSLVHVTASGHEIRAFRSDFTSNRQKWISVDLAWLAEHLFHDYRIVELAFTEIPDSIFWVRLSDGTIYSCVYDPAIDPNKVGWSKHPMSCEVLSIASLRDADYDRLYMTTSRTFVDGAGTVTNHTSLELTNKSSTMDHKLFQESGSPIASIDLDGSSLVGGLSSRYAVNGESQVNLCIMGDGAIDFYGTYDELVLTGRLTGTVYTMDTPSRFIEWGIPFTQAITPSDLDYLTEGSQYAEKKRHPKVWLDVIDSQPPMINGKPTDGRSTSTLMGNLETPIDGKLLGYSKGYSRDLHVNITQPYPFRLQLAAVLGVTNIGTTQ